MSESKKKILEMLAQNKITADEAYRLMSAGRRGPDMNAGHDNPGMRTRGAVVRRIKTRAKYLRVTVTPNPEGHNGGNGHYVPR